MASMIEYNMGTNGGFAGNRPFPPCGFHVPGKHSGTQPPSLLPRQSSGVGARPQQWARGWVGIWNVPSFIYEALHTNGASSVWTLPPCAAPLCSFPKFPQQKRPGALRSPGCPDVAFVLVFGGVMSVSTSTCQASICVCMFLFGSLWRK